jgi:hypothetical protein
MSARVYPEHQDSEEFDAEGYLEALLLRVKEFWEPRGEDGEN